MWKTWKRWLRRWSSADSGAPGNLRTTWAFGARVNVVTHVALANYTNSLLLSMPCCVNSVADAWCCLVGDRRWAARRWQRQWRSRAMQPALAAALSGRCRLCVAPRHLQLAHPE